jgi:hypothetical protein
LKEIDSGARKNRFIIRSVDAITDDQLIKNTLYCGNKQKIHPGLVELEASADIAFLVAYNETVLLKTVLKDFGENLKFRIYHIPNVSVKNEKLKWKRTI